MIKERIELLLRAYEVISSSILLKDNEDVVKKVENTKLFLLDKLTKELDK